MRIFILSLAEVGIQESDVKIKGIAANCVAIASAVIVRFRKTKASALHYRISTVLSKLASKYSFREKSYSALDRNVKTFDRHMSRTFD